jgi:hypothetical protein
VIVGADAELLLARRHGKQGQGIICRGTTAYTFKTVFGTVKVHRHRIEYRADGTTEVPSAHAWRTPRQVALTSMLRGAACDDLLRDSAQQTVARIDARAGESGVLARTTVLDIVGEEGQRLQAAAHARAEAISTRDPEALRLFVPARSQGEEVAEPGGADGGGGAAEAEAEEAAASALIGFPGGPADHPEVERDHPREVDPDVVLVELDEVKVHAQAHTGRKDLIGYLEVRRAYLPDYEARQWAGVWIASNRVEKFNDWSVSARCKHKGMEWTEAGVLALAMLEATRRNGELPAWRAKHSLPACKAPRGSKKVA